MVSIECLSAMHLFHHHRDDDGRRRRGWEETLENTCYNCGRQFMKHKSNGLHLRKHMHRCPGCHSEFDHDSSIADVVAKEANHRTRRRSCRNGCRFSASLPMRSLLAAIAPRKRKEQSDGAGNTATTTVHCSMDNIEESDRLDNAHVDAMAGRRKEQLDDDVIVDKNSYRAKIDPSPFAFTYETETVEPYQVHESQDESITQVETYQLEWLLFDV